ncbi:hypothetical protein AB6A40_000206 [Gnathostoma spinigerum]|uniref:Sterol regulatory element-binding protein cleavage-activating protein n=1 Tax=Gnathostoma spinigerum TaxID=75299 RepID=A0ABD6E3Q0_9BILA
MIPTFMDNEEDDCLKNRVAHAYYDYGRFCCAHPAAILSIAVITIVLLSYPTVIRSQLPISGPVDVHWNEMSQSSKDEHIPEWLHLKPSVYVQQIIVRGSVLPWNFSNLTSKMAVKGPLSRAFQILNQLENVKSDTDESVRSLSSICLRITDLLLPSEATELLPSSGCLILSPSGFWGNSYEAFLRDEEILKTIFSPLCTSSMCVRDMLLGMPTRMTGIKQVYQTNRQRSIDFAVTLFLRDHSSDYINLLRSILSQKFELLQSDAADDTTLVHVFYRPKKYLADYSPLMISYALMMLYFYFSASKIMMVRSKRVATAAVMTVFATFVTSVGIYIHLDLMPTLWAAQVSPYLALIIGVENTLSLTRSVVHTPSTMDVRSRLSHGLSQEGYSFTKYFLLELTFLATGYITCVPEIQEFCTLAFIGLVVDFYLQLVFFVPCLTFGLTQLELRDKHCFASTLFQSECTSIKLYPEPVCPMRRLWPSLFKQASKRMKSANRPKNQFVDEKLLKSASATPSNADSLDRSKSAKQVSSQLRQLYLLTKARIPQRFIMVLFVVWIILITSIIRKRDAISRLGSIFSFFNDGNDDNDSYINLSRIKEGFGISHRFLESAPLQWGIWQRKTFNWWPVLFEQYNLSLSGHYITYLPPIVLATVVPPSDVSINFDVSKSLSHGDGFSENLSNSTQRLHSTFSDSHFGSRLYRLEAQMAVIMISLVFFVFSTVGLFITHACFSRRMRNARSEKTSQPDDWDSAAQRSRMRKMHKRIGSKSFVDSVPLLFDGHTSSIECIAVVNADRVISVCLEQKIFVWNAKTGEKIMEIKRYTSPSDETSPSSSSPTLSSWLPTEEYLRYRTKPVAVIASVGSENKKRQKIPIGVSSGKSNEHERTPIWCMAVKLNIVVFGCADGSVEVASCETGESMGIYRNSEKNAGVIHIQFRASLIAFVRLDGTIEFVQVQVSPDQSGITLENRRIHRAHQFAVTILDSGPTSFITASVDHTIKVFDMRTMELSFTLCGHSAPVISITVNHLSNILYSSCEEGMICCWNLDDGQLLRTVDDVYCINETVELSSTDSFLIGYSSDCQLWLWDRANGRLQTRITPDTKEGAINKNSLWRDRYCIVAMNDQLVATSTEGCVLFWDLNYKMMIRKVPVSGSIDKLILLDSRSVICCCANMMYRIDVPEIRLK